MALVNMMSYDYRMLTPFLCNITLLTELSYRWPVCLLQLFFLHPVYFNMPLSSDGILLLLVQTLLLRCVFAPI